MPCNINIKFGILSHNRNYIKPGIVRRDLAIVITDGNYEAVHAQVPNSTQVQIQQLHWPEMAKGIRRINPPIKGPVDI